MKEFNLKETLQRVDEYKLNNFRPMRWYEKLYKRITWIISRFLT